MPTSIDLYKALRDHLVFDHVVSAKTGPTINTGEEFSVKFTVRNAAPAIFDGTSPDVVFINTKIRIEATPYATPIAGAVATPPLPKPILHPGESTDVVVKMKALKNLPAFLDQRWPETIAKVTLDADVDMAKFFHIHEIDLVYEELQP